jgi:hypothetical protein
MKVSRLIPMPPVKSMPDRKVSRSATALWNQQRGLERPPRPVLLSRKNAISLWHHVDHA